MIEEGQQQQKRKKISWEDDSNPDMNFLNKYRI